MMEDDDDFSAAATTVVFDRPIPLLRGPVPSGGSYVLAFRSLDSWSAAFKRCETLIKDQCEEGAKIGCAVSASNNCKPPWWRGSGGDMREREKCEEREFEGCVAAAKGKCAAFAKDKCSGAFLDARIAKREKLFLVQVSSKNLFFTGESFTRFLPPRAISLTETTILRQNLLFPVEGLVQVRIRIWLVSRSVY